MLGYLAARSRGDALGAPGDIGPAPPLRPQRRSVSAMEDVGASLLGFVEEHAEIERTSPHRRRPTGRIIPDAVPDRPIEAAPEPEAVPRVSAERKPAPVPTPPRSPTQVTSIAVVGAEAATPLKTPPPVAMTLTSAPAKVFAQPPAPGEAPAQSEAAAEPVSTATASERTAPDRTIVETRDEPAQTFAQSAADTRSNASTEAKAKIAPPEAEETPPVAATTDRSPTPLEQSAERPAPHYPEAPFERPAALPRVARENQASPPVAPPAAPQVQITIGRVEIRAAAPPPAPAPRGPVMSLDDYLAKRAGG
ncbi:hypothetical protein [Caulobacter endophyticus]|uniref:hypothetical protein n=1 Tax=Caulobacter endophyticus TaxID=2172652 RepID=UPI0011B1F8CA|nr:hypothetical protein [Caulobacter endophyticus]